MKYEDIRYLIDFAYDILNYYFVQFDGINRFIDLDYNKDLNNLLDMTIKYRKIRKKYFENRKIIENFTRSNQTDDVSNFLKELKEIIFDFLPKGVDRKNEI